MKILLVDDARSVHLVMTARLKSDGHEVLHAFNGREALAMFANSAPDLVLMDLEMPVMNGFEVTSRMRVLEAAQQWAWTPIIFLTSSESVDNLVTAIEAGGDDFISKLVPERVLRAKMQAMSRFASLRHSLSVANAKLLDLANCDGLTGLCNRRSLDLRLDVLWHQAQDSRASTVMGLLMIDIDNFKKFNDRYGHQCGDDALRSVALAIDLVVSHANTEGLLDKAFAARYGGEEFTVVAPGASAAVLATLAQRLVQVVFDLGIAHTLNEAWGVVTISLGGVQLDATSATLVALFRQADARLYLAKQRGRNQAVLQG